MAPRKTKKKVTSKDIPAELSESDTISALDSELEIAESESEVEKDASDISNVTSNRETPEITR